MIKRRLLKPMGAHIHKKEMTLIVGPRQSGKTTLMNMLKAKLEQRGIKTMFLNLDIEAHKVFLDSQSRLLQKIHLELGKKKGVVFLDEIQRKENAGLFLKGLYDMNLPYKFVVSGSGSMELKEKIHESLAGRKRIFELSPLTFEEFVNFKTNNKYENKIREFFAVEKEQTNVFLEEYLNYGGYPRAVLEEDPGEKQATLDEIYQSYLEKDISYLLGVLKTDAFTNLVRLLASQTGQLVNYSGLSSSLGISMQTVKQYLWYLEKTFVVHKVTPFFKNIRKEITKSPVYYFTDLGLRNHALGILGHIRHPQEKGFLFQNFIFHLLREKVRGTASGVHYWRTKDKAEVDFVVQRGKDVVPVEVKYGVVEKGDAPRSMRNFIAKYRPQKAFVVHAGTTRKAKVGKTNVYFVPFFRISL